MSSLLNDASDSQLSVDTIGTFTQDFHPNTEGSELADMDNIAYYIQVINDAYYAGKAGSMSGWRSKVPSAEQREKATARNIIKGVAYQMASDAMAESAVCLRVAEDDDVADQIQSILGLKDDTLIHHIKRLYQGILDGKKLDDPTLAKHVHVWRETFGVERYQARFANSVPNVVIAEPEHAIPGLINVLDEFSLGNKAAGKQREGRKGFAKAASPPSLVGPFQSVVTILKQVRREFSGPSGPSASRGPTVAGTPGFALPSVEGHDLFLLGTEKGERFLCSEHTWRKVFRGIAAAQKVDIPECFIKEVAGTVVNQIRARVKRA